MKKILSKDQRIDIRIKNNNRAFGLVAFLVDRDDFLVDLFEIRKLLKLSNFPYEFPEFPYDKANVITNLYKDGSFTIYEATVALQEFCTENHIIFSDLNKTWAAAFMFAESLTSRYRNNNKIYLPVILAALLVGYVQDADLSSTYMLVLDKPTLYKMWEDSDDKDKLVTIVVNRESTNDEVMDTFNFIKKYYFGTKKVPENDPLFQLYKDLIPTTAVPDTIKKIERDREWYWSLKSGEKLEKLVAKEAESEYSKSEAADPQKRIEAALTLYTSRLNLPLR